MKAIVYDFSLLKYVAAKTLGKFFPSFYYGRPSALSLTEVDEPSLPEDNWVKLKIIYSGICGSDIGAILYNTSPALTPYNSFPAVLGHEVVGTVTEVGDRISVNPYIDCNVREQETPCPECREGHPSLCRYTGGTDGFGPGMVLGFSNDLPGAWSEYIVVHETMVIPIPSYISDKVAAITEPLMVGLHAVLRQPPKEGEHVLVIGGGIIAYAVIAAIRLLKINCHITHVSLLPFQKEVGLRLGVNEGVTSRQGLLDVMLSLDETKSHKPVIGADVYRGGFDSVYDCIGSETSLDDALRMSRARGKVTLVGCAAVIKKLDWTFIWSNELSVLGAHGYSKSETWQGRKLSTEELLFELIDKQKDYPLEQLVTHEFTLEQYKEAIVSNLDRAKHKSIKTLFRL